jgi:hypothetical protein
MIALVRDGLVMNNAQGAAKHRSSFTVNLGMPIQSTSSATNRTLQKKSFLDLLHAR